MVVMATAVGNYSGDLACGIPAELSLVTPGDMELTVSLLQGSASKQLIDAEVELSACFERAAGYQGASIATGKRLGARQLTQRRED